MSVLVIDKPVGCTSFDVVRRVKAALVRRVGRDRVRALRIGHGGTLDPLASGVLPVCLGEATKLAQFLLDADKTYEATLRLGVETDTLDADGVEVERAAVPALEPGLLEQALARFRGPITQIPPMFSALKRAGRPLHEYAREGHVLERAARQVTVHELTLGRLEAPDTLVLRVRCSKGTYVRTLGADLARALGTRGHLSALRRLASGPFTLDEALPLATIEDALATGGALPVVSCAEAVRHLPAFHAGPLEAEALRQGKRVPWAALRAATPGGEGVGGLVRLLREDGSLLAVAPGPGPRPGEAPAPEAPGAGEGLVRTLRVFNPEAQSLTDPGARPEESSHNSRPDPGMRG